MVLLDHGRVVADGEPREVLTESLIATHYDADHIGCLDDLVDAARTLPMMVPRRLILVLEGGRVVERGTHAELLRGGRVYPKIYERELLKQELDRM